MPHGSLFGFFFFFFIFFFCLIFPIWASSDNDLIDASFSFFVRLLCFRLVNLLLFLSCGQK